MRGAIFDMDGTLLDSMHIWDEVGFTYLRERGVKPPDDLYETLRPLSLEQCALYFHNTLGVAEPPEQIVAQVNRLAEDAYFYEVQTKPGAAELVKQLHDAGVRLCVATATARYQSEAALGRLGLLPYFSFIMTCSEVGAGKDDPMIFRRALERLGTDREDTVVFEDALHAICTAKADGFYVAAVREASAAGDEREIKKLADVFLENIAEGGTELI